MPLTLSMLRCPDHIAPETRAVAGGEFSIGRGAENDWVLPDPERVVSKRQCLLAFYGGSWQVADLSTNGTFLNRESEPIGRDQVRNLRDGDRLCFDAFEIEVRIADDEGLAGSTSSRATGARVGARPETFALDPFAASPSGRSAHPLLGDGSSDDPFASGVAAPSILAADFDPLAPDPAAPGFRGPTQSDHNAHLEDAFVPPASQAVLPADWDRDEMAAPLAPVAPAVEREPAAPLAEPSGAAQPPASAPVHGPGTTSEDAFAAFLRGARLESLHLADPVATMEELGAGFREVVSGLRQAMIARAAVKGEFRIEQTTIRSRGNNPLKFSADDDDALAALLGAGRHSDIGAAAAIADALRDIRLHELATVAAMQAAVRALLGEFEPGKLREAAESSGLSLVAAQRKSRAWDAFEALYARITQALTDDFDSVFGKSFARAYEQALAEIAAKDPAT
jgi:type VI secretion system protein ImpI/type VI secretion system protein